MVPPAERFKNTTNRMMQNKDKKPFNGPGFSTQVSGSSGSSAKASINGTIASTGAKRGSTATFVKQAASALKKNNKDY
jgi:hypothetical protein